MSFPGVRSEQDIFVKLINSQTKEVCNMWHFVPLSLHLILRGWKHQHKFINSHCLAMFEMLVAGLG